jgi:hypothetical protein
MSMSGDERIDDDTQPARAPQPWSDPVRAQVVEINRHERKRRAKVARFQDRLSDMVVDDEVDAQPVVLIIAVVTKFAFSILLSGLTYAALWLTRGSDWSPAEVASGVLAAVVLGVIAGGIWHRMQHPELDPPEADVHAPDQWSLLRRGRNLDE